MIKAQEAYERSLQKLNEADITEVLAAVEKGINESIEKGGLVTSMYPIEEIKVAERAAIELRDVYGYNVLVLESPTPIRKEDGSFKHGCMLKVDWLYYGSNTRDKFSIEKIK